MTYRVGNHQPQNVYRDQEYIGVMFTAEDAALAVEALNGTPHTPDGDYLRGASDTLAAMRRRLLATEPGPLVGGANLIALRAACLIALREMADELGLNEAAPPADSCTCTIVGADPACPVHQGRRARGPKPPPVGEGCICDGSGRTCPRHGAVL